VNSPTAQRPPNCPSPDCCSPPKATLDSALRGESLTGVHPARTRLAKRIARASVPHVVQPTKTPKCVQADVGPHVVVGRGARTASGPRAGPGEQQHGSALDRQIACRAVHFDPFGRMASPNRVQVVGAGADVAPLLKIGRS
jgi:hypothetical protein